jgi:uncharacterized repeat protein (TIGR03803 family)
MNHLSDSNRQSSYPCQEMTRSPKSNLKVENSLMRMSMHYGWTKARSVFLLFTAAAISLSAQTLTTVHSFSSTDGMTPLTGLVQNIDGNLYGSTNAGGANASGTLFKITPAGTLTTLYHFCSLSGCADGTTPAGVLVPAVNGTLYGTAETGGPYQGFGTAFTITPGGTFTVLHDFGYGDGSEPTGLIQASNGDFYGTTIQGGTSYAGTFYKITPGGTLTSLASFAWTNGAQPAGSLAQASNGNFYGSTTQGGDVICTGGSPCGTVYEVTPTGAVTSLDSFCGLQPPCNDGAWPLAGLVQDQNTLYGTTLSGGNYAEGTVFKMTLEGTLTKLYDFTCCDVVSALIVGSDGNLYGTTGGGGANGLGMVFEITPIGTFTTLHSFDGTDGSGPQAPLMQDTNGIFYGTTSGGGANGDGTVFSLNTGLGPFVETLPDSGVVAAPVRILGTNFTGATGVTFNGVAATFTVVSPSLIRTTVPVGATTGLVKVTTPRGTLTSNVAFRVRP